MLGLIRSFYQHPRSTHFLAGLVSATILTPVIWTLALLSPPTTPASSTTIEQPQTTHQFHIYQNTPDTPLIEHLALDSGMDSRARTATQPLDDVIQPNYSTPLFLSAPVEGSHITSRFQPDRRHPILGIIRPHKGVDYAAPQGTPVRATATGTVVHASRKGGYGHTVILQHGDRYSTLYAHLSQYRNGLSVGDQIFQGDVIGFVGSTGLATGPHLHYELRIDGMQRDPILAKHKLNSTAAELPIVVLKDDIERSFFRHRPFAQTVDRTLF